MLYEIIDTHLITLIRIYTYLDHHMTLDVNSFCQLSSVVIVKSPSQTHTLNPCNKKPRNYPKPPSWGVNDNPGKKHRITKFGHLFHSCF
jgi:hypothetical protein